MLIEIKVLTFHEEAIVCRVVGTHTNVVFMIEEFEVLKANDKSAMINTLTSTLHSIMGQPMPAGADLTLPGQLALPGTGPDTPLVALQPLAQPEPGPEEPGTLEALVQPPTNELDVWLEENKVVKKNLPYKLNDDAEPQRKVLTTSLAAEIMSNFDTLEDKQKMLIAKKLARVKVQERMKFKDQLPKELKYMISHIVVSRDGPAKHMTPSESAFLDEETPEFGLNKKTPLSNIPEGFGDAARGPETNYRSPGELASMLKGDS